MTSLHWICALTLALVCCLTAQPLKRDVSSGLIQVFSIFTETVENAKCLDSDARFYTPADVHENCLGSALNCSLKELEILYDECKLAPQDEYEDIYASLFTELKAIHDTLGSSCSDQTFSCEKSPQKHFKYFLKNFQSLLQQINSQQQK